MPGVNIGIDLGTTRIVTCVEGKDEFNTQSAVVAYNKSGKMLAVGEKAYSMIGKEPRSIVCIRPMKDGVVSNFTVTEQMLRYIINEICGNEIFKPNLIVSIPGTVTNLEKRTILDVITIAGAGRVCLLQEPLAAAIGAGIDTWNPTGVMLVDLGGGTTDIAIITMGVVSVAQSIKTAGNKLNDSILRYVKRERNVLIGERTAEHIKSTIGCAYRRKDVIAMVAKGKDYISGMPVEFEISSDEVYFAIREDILSILSAVCSVFEQTPPELAADIMDEGVVLTGGTARLFGLDKAIEKRTGVKTYVADDPENCVIRGIKQAVENVDHLAESGYFFITREDITGVTNEQKGDDF